jgi:hypothetical protein
MTFSACMRAKGVPAFPDKGADGGYHIEPNDDVNPFSPEYSAVYQACAQLE